MSVCIRCDCPFDAEWLPCKRGHCRQEERRCRLSSVEEYIPLPPLPQSDQSEQSEDSDASDESELVRKFLLSREARWPKFMAKISNLVHFPHIIEEAEMIHDMFLLQNNTFTAERIIEIITKLKKDHPRSFNNLFARGVDKTVRWYLATMVETGILL